MSVADAGDAEDSGPERVPGADLGISADHADAVTAVLTASRLLVALTTESLGPVTADLSIAQYRMLVVLTTDGRERLTDLATALGVAPSTAGRTCDRLVRKGLVRRNRARTDRRAVLVSLTAEGRRAVQLALDRRRALVTAILAELPRQRQRELASALRAFTEAAGAPPVRQKEDPR